MSRCLQLEIDPLEASEKHVGSVLVAIDVLAYSRDECPGPEEPVCLIAAAHTCGLSSISKAYVKLLIAGSPTLKEEKLVLRDFLAYMDMFDGGTLAAHYGAFDQPEEGFDVPCLLVRARQAHPELYPSLCRTLARFRRHDTCRHARESMDLPSADLEYLEAYYGLARKPDAIIPDARSGMDGYWKTGDATVLKCALTNAYSCLRIAQSQLKKTICCTDIPL